MGVQTVVRNEPARETDAAPPLLEKELRTRAGSRPAGRVDRTAALLVQNLSKDFRSGFLRRRLRGIRDISFSVAPGEVFAILGHNGAGKTTTINCILDLVHADTGGVEIFGQPHGDRRARAQVGYLPERPYFFEHLTGRELLAFYADLLEIPAAGRAAHLDQVLARTGLTAAAGKRVGKYSKGMLQRIGLAQALLGDPRLLILDEPMSGLDPMGRREVRQLLLELKSQGKTIILSSHIVPDVEAVADSVAILRDGQLVRTGRLADISGDCSYEVLLEDGASGTLLAENLGALRELLDRCHADGVAVTRVEPRGSGLEDLFLAAHGLQEGGA